MQTYYAVLESRARYIDWELVTDCTTGERTAAFGTLAGLAGMADGLSNLSMRLLALGFATPFLVRVAFYKVFLHCRTK